MERKRNILILMLLLINSCIPFWRLGKCQDETIYKNGPQPISAECGGNQITKIETADYIVCKCKER